MTKLINNGSDDDDDHHHNNNNNNNNSITNNNNKITETKSRVRVLDTLGGAGWVDIANTIKKS